MQSTVRRNVLDQTNLEKPTNLVRNVDDLIINLVDPVGLWPKNIE